MPTTTRHLRLTAGPRPLDAVLHLPAARQPRPLVLQCHGFKGFMDWGFHPPLADLLCEKGFAVLRFNFSGSGVAPGEDVVSDPQAFRDATYSRDVEDLRSIFSEVAQLDPERIDADRVGLFGHSRGGGAAILAAAGLSDRPALKALVTWNAIGEVHRFRGLEEQWRRDGELPIHNGRTGQTLPISTDLLDDIEENAEALDLMAAAARRSAPWLIVHGSEDETVDPAEGDDLAAAAAPPVLLHRIAGAGHTLGAKHPFQGPTPHLIDAMNATLRWLDRNLRR